MLNKETSNFSFRIHPIFVYIRADKPLHFAKENATIFKLRQISKV